MVMKKVYIVLVVIVLFLMWQFGVFSRLASPYRAWVEYRGINYQSQEELEAFMTEWTNYIVAHDCHWTGAIVMNGFAEIGWQEKKSHWWDLY
jgi:hypothetical protein